MLNFACRVVRANKAQAWSLSLGELFAFYIERNWSRLRKLNRNNVKCQPACEELSLVSCRSWDSHLPPLAAS